VTAKRSRAPWHAVWNNRRRWWEVRNGKRDALAVVYTGKPDACFMAAAPRLLTELKHLIAIVRMHEGELRASELAKLDAAVKLVNELNARAA
jgi:hypothetical protein